MEFLNKKKKKVKYTQLTGIKVTVSPWEKNLCGLRLKGFSEVRNI